MRHLLQIHPKPTEGYIPRVFGWEHLTYLAIFFVLAIGTLILIYYKVKSERDVQITVKCTGACLLIAILANRISLIEYYGTPMGIIPNTFCGTTSLIFALCAIFLKRDSLLLNFAVYAGFWGGIIVTFYPNFVVQDASFMYPPTITGILHHGLSAYLAVVMLMTGFFKPNLKKFYVYPITLCVIMTYGIFLMDALKIEESMYIFAPVVPGTFLTWYVVGPMLILGNLGLVALYEKIIVPRLRNKNQVT